MKRDQYTAATSFDTPITIFGYSLGNRFQVNEKVLDYPQKFVLTDPVTGSALGDHIFPNWYETDIDWSPNFTLPPLFRSLFNITPGVSLANVTSGPFWVRTNLSMACSVSIPNGGALIFDGGKTATSATNRWLIISPVAVDSKGNPLKLEK